MPARSAASFEYEVALSFAGEDRARADALAQALRRRGIATFYDEHEKAALWGKDLYSFLSDLYQNRARFCVMFVSRHYEAKLWTNHERQAAQARAFQESREYILPIRLDETQIPGLLPTVGYLSWPPEDVESIADAIARKLGRLGPGAPLTAPAAPSRLRQAATLHSAVGTAAESRSPWQGVFTVLAVLAVLLLTALHWAIVAYKLVEPAGLKYLDFLAGIMSACAGVGALVAALTLGRPLFRALRTVSLGRFLANLGAVLSLKVLGTWVGVIAWNASFHLTGADPPLGHEEEIGGLIGDAYGGLVGLALVSPLAWPHRTRRFLLASGGALLMAAAGLAVWVWAQSPVDQILRGHVGPVTGLAFSPDGKAFASVGEDNRLNLWHYPTGELLRSFQLTGPAAFTAVAFRPAGPLVATGEHGNSQFPIRLWDFYSGVQKNVLHGHSGNVTALAFVGDSLYSAGLDGKLHAWDLATGKPAATVSGAPVQALVVGELLPDRVGRLGSNLLAGHDNGEIALWDPARLEPLGRLAGRGGSIRSLAFDPKRRLLAAAVEAQQSLVIVYDLDHHREKYVLPNPEPIPGLAFLGDDRLAGAEGSGNIRIWSMADGFLFQTLRVPMRSRHRIEKLLATPDGLGLLTGDAKGSIRFWSAAAPSFLRQEHTVPDSLTEKSGAWRHRSKTTLTCSLPGQPLSCCW